MARAGGRGIPDMCPGGDEWASSGVFYREQCADRLHNSSPPINAASPNRVSAGSKCSFTVPIGPWRCFAIITSARLCAFSQRRPLS